jgi:hypothetical protein
MKMTEIAENIRRFQNGEYERASSNLDEIVEYFCEHVDQDEFSKFMVAMNLVFDTYRNIESAMELMQCSITLTVVLSRYKEIVIKLLEVPQLDMKFV